MPRRAIAIFLMCFQVMWLNIILPGHLRGIVMMPRIDGSASCCGERNDKPLTQEQRAKHCALCFFSAHWSLPPVVAFQHASLGLLQRIRQSESDDLFARIVLLPFDCCGPPAIA